ncbi:MAG: hypothetical protein KKF50_04605 [Nanoarchaeota archaeon]|nr:hypothetical protein [Nanoarchaeota archaeon]
MISKRGAMGEGVFMIYRLLLVSVIAFAIFGISSIFYAYEIEVRDSEAVILTRQVSECLAPEGVFNLDLISEDSRKSILSYCGLSNERFYVGVEVLNEAGDVIAEFSQGDSGSGWVRKLTQGAGQYDPGYRIFEYPVLIGQGISEIEGKIKMEVIVSHEF